ncbi:hypothetical protein H072_6209 [Dactylellina haptotyla CBS 200.50]|uniref:Phospholipase/carboxylesterase/thioesterase domain-containing protein n=1 Tax=Dactylellina haptotyla (strain CBS 200.50) TaxID=1284197 RepID=S8BKG1_DACHA|nr:hypothetical protein H072_6209 [Dactylellina haptotyla CBS 200.50]
MEHPESTTTQHAPPRIFEAFREPCKSTVIFLHGRGDSGHNVAPFLLFSPVTSNVPTRLTLRQVLPHTKFIFPTALKREFSSSYLSTQWFEIDSLEITDLNEERQADGLKESTEYIHQLIQDEIDSGVPPEQIILMGQGQGCAAGIVATMRYPGRIGAFIGMSGWMPFVTQLEDLVKTGADAVGIVKRIEDLLESGREVDEEVSKSIVETPVFVGHGINDTKVLVRCGERLQDLLKDIGFHNVKWATYKLGNWWCDEEIVDAARWLADENFEVEGLEELKNDTQGARITTAFNPLDGNSNVAHQNTIDGT